MNFEGFLKALAIDTWYKAIIYVAGLVLVVSFFVEVRGLTNGQLQLLSAGSFLFAIGEWKNHKVKSWIKPPNVYTGGAALMSTTVRQADLVGVLFQLAGAALICIGAWNILGPA